MKNIVKYLVAGAAMLASVAPANAQVVQMTREQILAMSTDELAELPLEDLMAAVEILGVSSVDELFALIMNKSVSSASKEEESAFTSPLATTTVTREELRTYGVTTIEEAFRLIPGMIVSEKTNGIYDVQMRGLNNIPDNNIMIYTENANILVMVDGRIAHSYATGAPTFEALPIGIEDIERIEVVRGATSALYGPNAVNGVVNIITAKPDQSKQVVSGSMQAGNRTFVGDFALRQKVNEKFALGLSGNFQMRYRENNLVPSFTQQNYYYIKDLSVLGSANTMSQEEIAAALASGKMVDMSKEQIDLEVSQVPNVYTVVGAADGYYQLAATVGEDLDIYSQWSDPSIARKTMGVNGYVALTPSEKVRIDVQGGYQYAFFANSAPGNEDMALRYRKNEGAYVNVNAQIAGLRLLANYYGGNMDMNVGTQGFCMDRARYFNAQAEYDFEVGPVSIKPGVAYQYTMYRDAKPRYYDYGNGPEEMSGYFGYYSRGEHTADIYTVSPSLRADYKVNDFRLVAAFRADKTSIPDKWNPSWQFAASYLLNDKNFVRLSYGRSFRSAALMNTSSNYTWRRPEGMPPTAISFLGNTEADLMHIDNIEIGYRVSPTSALLIDAEAFYSISKDYGELKAHSSAVVVGGQDLAAVVAGAMSGNIGSLGDAFQAGLKTRSWIKYDNVPFEVHQMGIGVNVDWVISSKLIAKLNANVQRTTIDNYYQYDQSGMIMKQLMASQAAITDSEKGVGSLFAEMMVGAAEYQASGAGTMQQYMAGCMNYSPANEYQPIYDAMSAAEQEAFLQQLKDAFYAGEKYEDVENPMSLYYGLKYGIRLDSRTNEYYFGTTVAENPETSNGYRHKASPSVYGMLGLIFKPTEQWNIGAFANFMGKRELKTYFANTVTDPRFTVNLKVGYKPVDNCEVFFNAHNLFNNREREFFIDKIGGIYTVGVNFGI